MDIQYGEVGAVAHTAQKKTGLLGAEAPNVLYQDFASLLCISGAGQEPVDRSGLPINFNDGLSKQQRQPVFEARSDPSLRPITRGNCQRIGQSFNNLSFNILNVLSSW